LQRHQDNNKNLFGVYSYFYFIITKNIWRAAWSSVQTYWPEHEINFFLQLLRHLRQLKRRRSSL